MANRKKIGIIGAGAAGLTAAFFAAKQGADIVLFERNERVGKKILVTGNGKCNLGNLDLNSGHYYSSEPKKIEGYLKQFGTQDTIHFFEKLGVMILSKNGYLYPHCEQASVVLDALRFFVINHNNIRLLTDTKVKDIRMNQEKQQIAIFTEKNCFYFDSIIIACGGKAAPKTGSDGNGYQLAGRLGHSLVPVVPALVQLKCKESWMKSIAGVRADACISLIKNNKEITRERGELQLTDYGISGIPVFQLSRTVNYLLRETKEVRIHIDFFPDEIREGFEDEMQRKRASLEEHYTCEQYFTGILNKKLMGLMMKLAGLKPNEFVKSCDRDCIKKVFSLCRELIVHVNGSNSFEQAQVCAGGIPLCEVTDQLESRIVPGVYFAGEILDIDGRCGGYNLQWAWCSGYIAGRSSCGMEE